VGFIHHTFDEEYSVYNSTNLFKNPEFIQSLENCRGLFVLSNYMIELTQNALNDLSASEDNTSHFNFSNIYVTALKHPTEPVDPDKIFTTQNFLQNDNRLIVHIGAWLRDMFAIYRLPDLSLLGISKAILHGPDMNNYMIPENFFSIFDHHYNEETEDFDNDQVGDEYYSSEDPLSPGFYQEKQVMCRDISTNTFAGNKFVKGVRDYIDHLVNTVTIIPELNNEDYDTLLSQNYVYIQLHEASAVNTIIECIRRRTPIIVNKIPSTVELLGEHYPFYYDQNIHSPEYLRRILDPRMMVSAPHLLEYRDVDLSIETFLENFINSDCVRQFYRVGEDGFE
jgi:hypothetical protein